MSLIFTLPQELSDIICDFYYLVTVRKDLQWFLATAIAEIRKDSMKRQLGGTRIVKMLMDSRTSRSISTSLEFYRYLYENNIELRQWILPQMSVGDIIRRRKMSMQYSYGRKFIKCQYSSDNYWCLNNSSAGDFLCTDCWSIDPKNWREEDCYATYNWIQSDPQRKKSLSQYRDLMVRAQLEAWLDPSQRSL